ncbi:MAG: GAF domain-containing protein [Thermoleophilia bacterium]
MSSARTLPLGWERRALESFDGGRSHEVQRALAQLVEQIRVSLGADVAVAAYRARPGEPHARVLAAAGAEASALPLPNEPLWLAPLEGASRPQALRELALRSTMRPFALELVSALVVPWSHTSGRGWLVAGMLPGRVGEARLDLGRARGQVGSVRDAHVLAGLRGAARLQREVARAGERIAAAEGEAPDPGVVLAAVARAARALLGTEAAYVALPGADGSFAMASSHNVRTAAFRHLRIAPEQGLGGLASVEQQPIISFNYAEDRRLHDPPLAATLAEGLVSALCVPLLVGDAVAGLVYVANRELTPFTQADAAVLHELGRHAAAGLRRADLERQRRAATRQREREELAFRLHDSVVRGLTEISFEADAGFHVHEQPAVRDRFERIGLAVEGCLDAIRQELSRLVSPGERPAARTSLAELVEQLATPTSSRSVPRRVELLGARAGEAIPGPTASALLAIAHEALRNVDLHAGASEARVTLALDGASVRLTVEDDGRGLPDATAVALADEATGHLGVRRMRRAAEDVGGGVVVATGPRGGVLVEATLPA